ncbi:MAG: SMP-30/gluconolactonase/LRE family protein [Pirellulaceae bacterium]
MLTCCKFIKTCTFWLLVLACVVTAYGRLRAQEPAKAKLFLHLDEKYNTPDGMALLPNGDFILSVPNFNDLSPGAYMLRISARNEVSEFLKLPDHPETGKPVGALGVCVAPSGDLFLADYQSTGDRQSRVLKIVMKDDKPVDLVPVVTGFHVSNAVICRNGYLYVSETQIDTKSQPATSGVFRFKLEELTGDPVVTLADDETKDPHFLGLIEVHDAELPLGADGLCFDKQGNLYIGNFADGTVHQFKFNNAGKVVSNKVFARADFMKSADGLTFDSKNDIIYVADSRMNAVQMVFPNGTVKTLASNGDTDGLDGGMDQPCETLLRGRELIVSNMDWPVPGTINKEYNLPSTLSVIPVK